MELETKEQSAIITHPLSARLRESIACLLQGTPLEDCVRTEFSDPVHLELDSHESLFMTQILIVVSLFLYPISIMHILMTCLHCKRIGGDSDAERMANGRVQIFRKLITLFSNFAMMYLAYAEKTEINDLKTLLSVSYPGLICAYITGNMFSNDWRLLLTGKVYVNYYKKDLSLAPMLLRIGSLTVIPLNMAMNIVLFLDEESIFMRVYYLSDVLCDLLTILLSLCTTGDHHEFSFSGKICRSNIGAIVTVQHVLSSAILYNRLILSFRTSFCVKVIIKMISGVMTMHKSSDITIVSMCLCRIYLSSKFTYPKKIELENGTCYWIFSSSDQ